MTKSIYDFKDYKEYLNEVLREEGKIRSGRKLELSKFVGCHSAYVSQVLNGNAHFNLEQASKINRFLGHKKLESHYFLLILQYARAGTPELKDYFREQIQDTIEKQFDFKSRLHFKKTLSLEHQSVYYSQWYTAAVHVLVSIPNLKTVEDFANYLSLSPEKIAEALEFLERAGLIQKKGERYDIGTGSIHLGQNSPLIARHHTNWRVRALQSLDEPRQSDMHYSSVITASKQDSVQIRSLMAKAIEEIRKVVGVSRDESGYCYSMDFFEIGAHSKK